MLVRPGGCRVNARLPTVGDKTDDRHGEPIKNLEGYLKATTDGTDLDAGDSHVGTGVETHHGGRPGSSVAPRVRLGSCAASSRTSRSTGNSGDSSVFRPSASMSSPHLHGGVPR